MLASIINNSKRRGKENKFDDAVARLYRSFELIAQIRLLEKYNIDTNRVDIAVGGSTRNETIMNGCKLIEEKYGLTDIL